MILLAFCVPILAEDFIVTEAEYVPISGNVSDTLGRTRLTPDSIRITVMDSNLTELFDAWFEPADAQCALNGDIIGFSDQWEDINGAASIGLFHITATIASDGQGDVDVFSQDKYTLRGVTLGVNQTFDTVQGSKDLMDNTLDVNVISAGTAAIEDGDIASIQVNVESISSGAITSTSIATSAIGSDEFATTAVRELADAVWDQISPRAVVEDSTGNNTTRVQTNLAEATDNHYNGQMVLFMDGTEEAEARLITDHDGTNGWIEFTPALTGTPGTGDSLRILPWALVSVASVTAGAIDAAAIADDAIDYGTFAATAPTAWWNEGKTGYTAAVSDKTGFALSAAGVDALWDEPVSGHTTANTFGDTIAQVIEQAGVIVNDFTTGVIDADAIGADAIGASEIATDAMGSAEIADDIVGRFADTVWQNDSASMYAGGVGTVGDVVRDSAFGAGALSTADIGRIADTVWQNDSASAYAGGNGSIGDVVRDSAYGGAAGDISDADMIAIVDTLMGRNVPDDTTAGAGFDQAVADHLFRGGDTSNWVSIVDIWDVDTADVTDADGMAMMLRDTLEAIESAGGGLTAGQMGSIADSVWRRDTSDAVVAGSMAMVIRDTIDAILDAGGGITDAQMGAIADSVWRLDTSDATDAGGMAMMLRDSIDNIVDAVAGLPDSTAVYGAVEQLIADSSVARTGAGVVWELRGLYVTAGGTDSTAVQFTGNGAGEGFKVIGGGTGHATEFTGGVAGAGAGFQITGGTNGDGIAIDGGATSGDGIDIDVTDGMGLRLVGDNASGYAVSISNSDATAGSGGLYIASGAGGGNALYLNGMGAYSDLRAVLDSLNFEDSLFDGVHFTEEFFDSTQGSAGSLTAAEIIDSLLALVTTDTTGSTLMSHLVRLVGAGGGSDSATVYSAVVEGLQDVGFSTSDSTLELHQLAIRANSSLDTALIAVGADNGQGAYFGGAGTGDGIKAVGGAGGAHGLHTIGTLANDGIRAQGGLTGSGIRAIGGGTAGYGIRATGTGGLIDIMGVITPSDTTESGYAVSSQGFGASANTLYFNDTSGTDTPIGDVFFRVRNGVGTSVLAFASETATGKRTIYLTDGSYTVEARKTNYLWNVYDLTVSGNDDSIEVAGYDRVVGSSGAAGVCRMYGYTTDVGSDWFKNVSITAGLAEDTYDSCANTIVFERTKGTRSNDTGYFYIDLIYSSCLSDEKYQFTFEKKNHETITKSIIVPDSTSHYIRWED